MYIVVIIYIQDSNDKFCSNLFNYLVIYVDLYFRQLGLNNIQVSWVFGLINLIFKYLYIYCINKFG